MNRTVNQRYNLWRFLFNINVIVYNRTSNLKHALLLNYPYIIIYYIGVLNPKIAFLTAKVTFLRAKSLSKTKRNGKHFHMQCLSHIHDILFLSNLYFSHH